MAALFGIIGAIEKEISPFIASMSDIQIEKHAMLSFHKGTYKHLDVIALFCGVGKVNAAIAAQILIDTYQVSQIIMVGTAGAISGTLHIGDTVISSETAYHDMADEILTEYHPWMKSIYFTADKNLVNEISKANAHDNSVVIGRMVTGEAFIHQNGRKEIIEKYNPLCVDMETASVAHVCYVNAIPFAAIRSISDTPSEGGNDTFEKHVETAVKKSIAVLRNYLDSL